MKVQIDRACNLMNAARNQVLEAITDLQHADLENDADARTLEAACNAAKEILARSVEKVRTRRVIPLVVTIEPAQTQRVDHGGGMAGHDEDLDEPEPYEGSFCEAADNEGARIAAETHEGDNE